MKYFKILKGKKKKLMGMGFPPPPLIGTAIKQISHKDKIIPHYLGRVVGTKDCCGLHRDDYYGHHRDAYCDLHRDTY